MSRIPAVVPLLIAAAAACTWGGEGGLVLLAVAPAEAPNHLDVELGLTGRDFEPAIEVDFDRPRDSNIDAGFAVTLVSGGARIALGAVERVSSSELHATVAAGTPPGTYDVAVRDPRGRVATLPAAFVLFAQVAVTTAADEADVGATPASSGGTGFSLREAIAWANAQSFATTITIAAPITITMTPPQTYMTLTAPGGAVVAEPGVILDFGGINQPCLTLNGPGQRLVGVTLRGCEGTFVSMSTASAGSQVAQITTEVTNPAKRYWAYGIVAGATSATPSRIGPGNDLSGLWIGVNVAGSGYEIIGNRFHDNSVGAKLLAGSGARLWQNTFSVQVKSLPQEGIGVIVANGAGTVEILHNVLERNAGSGLQSGSVAGLTVRNNLFVGNGGFGLDAPAAGLVHDHNGYFGNASGAVSAGLSTGATDLLVDPLFADAPGGDLRLLPTSPAIDAGVDTGLDVNGPVPGAFNGAAPDLGAFEFF